MYQNRWLQGTHVSDEMKVRSGPFLTNRCRTYAPRVSYLHELTFTNLWQSSNSVYPPFPYSRSTKLLNKIFVLGIWCIARDDQSNFPVSIITWIECQRFLPVSKNTRTWHFHCLAIACVIVHAQSQIYDIFSWWRCYCSVSSSTKVHHSVFHTHQCEWWSGVWKGEWSTQKPHDQKAQCEGTLQILNSFYGQMDLWKFPDVVRVKVADIFVWLCVH